MPKFLSFTQAKNALCSLYPSNPWAKKYRSTESDKQAYRDRQRLCQIIHDAPVRNLKESPEEFVKRYHEWRGKAIKLLHSHGEYPYKYFQNPYDA